MKEVSQQEQEYLYQHEEDEIDLRSLLEILWLKRKFIFAFTFLTAFSALVISLLLPRQYTAEAFIYIRGFLINPPEEAFISPNISVAPDIKSATQRAKTPALLQSVLMDETVSAILPKEISLEEFARRLEVEGAGNYLIGLKVTDTDPERAVLIANTWARKLTESLNASYAFDLVSQELLTNVNQSYQEYQQAQAALDQALANSRVQALDALLESKQAELRDTLNDLVRISNISEELDIIEQQLKKQPPDSPISLNDALSLVTLHQRALMTTSSIPFILHLDSTFASLTVAQGLQTVVEMRLAMESRLQRLQDDKARLEKEIPSIRSELSRAKAALDEFISRRDQTKSLYQTLRSNVEFLRVLQNTSQVASVSLLAVAVENPSSGAQRVLMGAIVGLLLSVAWVLVENWWKNSSSGY